MVKRIVVWGALIAALAGVYLFGWCVALRMQLLFRHVRMARGHEIASPVIPLSLLWMWAEALETATRERIPALFSFACVTFAGLVALAILLPP